jgi:DNA-3-methyladenine glycosylase
MSLMRSSPAARLTGRELFRGATPAVARRLLGALLVHEEDGCRVAGRIVEVEAYLSRADPASHSHGGRTARNASMFLAPGHAYVYRIYGMHHCFNVVTAREGIGEAVLVRALEPLEGLEAMASRRGRSHARDLCSGPAKLVQALGIGPRHDGLDLVGGALRIELAPEPIGEVTIRAGPRIGISKAVDLHLRFAIAGAPWLSRP